MHRHTQTDLRCVSEPLSGTAIVTGLSLRQAAPTKGREHVLKERISSLFRELQGLASENKDREYLLQRYRALISEILEKLVLEEKGCVAECCAMIIRFQEGSRR